VAVAVVWPTQVRLPVVAVVAVVAQEVLRY
jgi:hypothetical protein